MNVGARWLAVTPLSRVQWGVLHRPWSDVLVVAVCGVVLVGCHAASLPQDMAPATPDAAAAPDGAPDEEPPLFCPPYTEVHGRLLDGTVTFQIAGRPEVTQTLSSADPPGGFGPGRCSAGPFDTRVQPGEELPTPLPGEWLPGAGSYTIDCDLGETTLSATFILFDPRLWPPGRYERPDPPVGGHLSLVTVFAAGSCGGSAPLELRAEVTHAAGGPAPYPDAVTPDYLRELVLHLRSSRATTSDDSCPPATLSADLHFLQTAADTENHPHPICGRL